MKPIVILFSRFDETLTYAIEEFAKYTERMSGHTLTVTSRHVPVLPRENAEGVIRFGLFADLCGEAFRDQYNGLQPSEHDQTAFEGYAGFPLDLRFSLSFGVIYRINY